MATRFNPPPNWPQPPVNWSPEPGWKPDPRWGSPPAGWQLWVDADEAPPADVSDKRPPQRIFISYRRSDCQPQANGLYDGLRFRLPSAHLFMDIEAMPAGVDFEEHIRAEIEVCDLVLVMIGDNWLDRLPETGLRRIDDPADFVRLEIEAGLKSPRSRLIPVLVEGAEMPRREDMPESIRGLARLHAIELSDHRWPADLERLSQRIEAIRKEELDHATGHTNPHIRIADLQVNDPAPVELTDIVETAVSAAVAAQSGTFRTKDVSQSSGVLQAHTAISGRPKYDEIVGRYMNEHRKRLGLRAPAAATDARGWVWTKAVPAPVPPPIVPTPKPAPWTAPPPYVKPASNSSTVIGWVLAIVPFVTCGLGAFAPAAWAASKRRGDGTFRFWAFAIATAGTAMSIVGAVIFYSAPQDFSGSPSGPQSDFGMGLWLIGALGSTVLAVIAVVIQMNRDKAQAAGQPARRP